MCKWSVVEKSMAYGKISASPRANTILPSSLKSPKHLAPRSAHGRHWIKLRVWMCDAKASVPMQPHPFLPQKCPSWDFPGGAVVKSPPANAGGTGSIPGLRRPHMPRSSWACALQLLSLHSRAREPQLLSPHATTTEGRAPRARAPQQREATAMRSPHTAMKSSPRVAPARHN